MFFYRGKRKDRHVKNEPAMSILSFRSRAIALLVCGGIAAAALWVPAVISSHSELGEWRILGAMFVIGLLVTAIIGLPLLYVIDRWLRFRGNYVVGGALYGLIFWILMDAPIFPKDWHRLSESWFWLNFAPRRAATSVVFGALVGMVYSVVIWLLVRRASETSI